MPCRDTSALWADYHSRASAQPSLLARAPRWRAVQSDYLFGPSAGPPAAGGSPHSEQRSLAPTPVSADWKDESERVQRRRDLRRQLREASYLDMAEKRDLVGGLPSMRDAPKARSKEHERQLNQEVRIKGVMQDCSRARNEIVALQRMMVGVSSPPAKGHVDDFIVSELIARRATVMARKSYSAVQL